MRQGTKHRGALLVMLACAAMVAAACGSSSPAASSTTTSNASSARTSSSVPPGVLTGGTSITGGTVVFAEPPNTRPNWIWPFMSLTHFSVSNISDFQYLMYRPLYYFGKGENPVLNTTKSLGEPPVWNGKTVTISLKPYTWSNGTPVTSTDVEFWLNMMKAEKANWAAYVPGAIPDNIKSTKIDSPSSITLTLNGTYAHNWFLFNELSQITPMPAAWDRTASGPSDCDTTVADCAAVYKYLNDEAKNLKGYAGSALWGVVDGPWKLSAFSADGHITMVPNTKYSGPNKPKISVFKEVPFTTDTAEYNVLRSGSTTVQVGYIPTQSLVKGTTNPSVAGPNPLKANFYMAPWIGFSINYFPINYNNPTVGPIFQHLYIRQALQHLVDQAAVIKGPLKGYGYLTTGPIPLLPTSDLLSTAAKSDPYPFSISAAKTLLAQNGWTVPASGAATCAKPGTGKGECGAGVKAGQSLTFNLEYASGTAWINTSMEALKSNASKAGIVINLSTAPFDTVIAHAAQCKSTDKNCTWEMENWGGGWVYAPDYYPTGGEIFATGAGSNSGSYNDATNDANIKATHTTDGVQVLQKYGDYLAKQVPVLWQPNADYSLTEVANNLRGVIPQNVYLNLNPEDWYYVK